jgi:methionyl aminopeptidase
MPACPIYTNREIQSIREAGAVLRACLAHTAALVVPGITTIELDRAAEEFIRSHEGTTPAFKGYQGFPATLCTSVNEECVHAIPGSRMLKEGDIISLDCGVCKDGLYTDACISVPVGKIGKQAQHLLGVTSGALKEVVRLVRSGARVGDLSACIQTYAEERGCTPMISLTGHGVGHHLHDFPDIPNIGTPGTGPTLPAGTVIAIEPILSLGTGRVVQAEDGWTLKTADASLSAHFEHTILVTENGCEVLA